MEVAGSGAIFGFDCAHGAIPTGITLDPLGRFEAKGTYTEEHHGPAPQDEEPKERPALYSGNLSGDTLYLSVKLEPGDEVGTFQLKHGQEPRLVKCR